MQHSGYRLNWQIFYSFTSVLFTHAFIKGQVLTWRIHPSAFPLIRQEGCQLWLLCYSLKSQTSFWSWTRDLRRSMERQPSPGVKGSQQAARVWLVPIEPVVDSRPHNRLISKSRGRKRRLAIKTMSKQNVCAKWIKATNLKHRYGRLLMGLWSGSPITGTRSCLSLGPPLERRVLFLCREHKLSSPHISWYSQKSMPCYNLCVCTQNFSGCATLSWVWVHVNTGELF